MDWIDNEFAKELKLEAQQQQEEEQRMFSPEESQVERTANWDFMEDVLDDWSDMH